MTAYKKSSRPFVKWHHIDGPVLVARDGQLYWLTWKERFALWFKLRSIEEIEAERMKK